MISSCSLVSTFDVGTKLGPLSGTANQLVEAARSTERC